MHGGTDGITYPRKAMGGDLHILPASGWRQFDNNAVADPGSMVILSCKLELPAIRSSQVVVVATAAMLLAHMACPSIPPALALSPAQTLKERGDFLFFHGDLDAAIEAFERASNLDPTMWDAQISLVSLYMKRGDSANALAAARSAVRLKPSDAKGHILLGNLLRANSQHDEAISELNEALRLKAEAAPINMILGFLHLNKGDLDKAEQSFKMAESGKGSKRDASLGLAIVLFRRGQKELAVKHIDSIISSQKDSFPAGHEIKAHFLASMSKTEEALLAYNKAVENNPNAVQIHLAVGNIHFKQKAYDKAEAAFRQALSLKMQDPAIHYALAITLEKLNKLQEAYEHFQTGAAWEKDSHVAAKMRHHAAQLNNEGLAFDKSTSPSSPPRHLEPFQLFPKSPEAVFGVSYSQLVGLKRGKTPKER